MLINVNTECSVMLYFFQSFLLRLFEFDILYAPIFSLTLCTLRHCVVFKIAVNILDGLGLSIFFFLLIYSWWEWFCYSYNIHQSTWYTYCPVYVHWWILIEYWLLSTWERWTSSNLLFSLFKGYLCVIKFNEKKNWIHA